MRVAGPDPIRQAVPLRTYGALVPYVGVRVRRPDGWLMQGRPGTNRGPVPKYKAGPNRKIINTI